MSDIHVCLICVCVLVKCVATACVSEQFKLTIKLCRIASCAEMGEVLSEGITAVIRIPMAQIHFALQDRGSSCSRQTADASVHSVICRTSQKGSLVGHVDWRWTLLHASSLQSRWVR